MGSVIARFDTVGEAEAARSALDAAGIEAYFADENMIAVDWLSSNAIGGVKLVTAPEDAESAQEVLAMPATEAGDAAEEPVVESAGLEDADCPSCGATEIYAIPRLKLLGALSVVAVGVGVAVNEPLLTLSLIAVSALITAIIPSHRCGVCGDKFNVDLAEERDEVSPFIADSDEITCPRCGMPEVYRLLYRRLKAASLLTGLSILIVLPLWIVLPRWKCDSCGLRLWLRPVATPKRA